MNVLEGVDAWQSQYSGQPPVGFMLRFSHESVWTRLQFARDDARPGAGDDRLIASRLDTVASSLFTGATVLVAAIRLGAGQEDTNALRDLGATAISPPESWLEALGSYLPDPSRAEFMATTVGWQRGCLDRVWLAVTREWIGRVAVFCPATGDALCPYDGGADVFVWAAERRAKMGERFKAWVPRAAPAL
ncbi:MAG: hypothetical protein ABSC46_06485 [Candidatus Limnocylindrales bacterium]|jgi:hypothetical protein